MTTLDSAGSSNWGKYGLHDIARPTHSDSNKLSGRLYCATRSPPHRLSLTTVAALSPVWGSPRTSRRRCFPSSTWSSRGKAARSRRCSTRRWSAQHARHPAGRREDLADQASSPRCAAACPQLRTGIMGHAEGR